MEISEISSDIRKLPKDEIMIIMRFRLLSNRKKMQFLVDLDRELEEIHGKEGRKIFDDIFNIE